ncbi:hypothetical protein BZG36_05179 [Bifiguratus adelaidae]|uniref:Enoyl reductase (ER) domain-containing protein n=1 Tax=Bifiguratus adelaidae TaxID=1938954 RepID=A0A261XTN4_9FUNG|nr:hypothetical protein BZG36_05179 [Bifiguratus adelaidae]
MPAQDTNRLNGYACPGKGQPLKLTSLPLKTFTENDVDIDITHCGICGSDIHTMDEGWGHTLYPATVGHEIAGVVARVGTNVKNVKVGDRAGVGAQCDSCGSCEECQSGNENICSGKGGMISTYNSRHPDGTPTQGGYADKWRGNSRFVFKIPDNMSNEDAACFFCAGVTTFAPLKRAGVNANSKVGVIGIGGLGHFGVQWARAMGAEVTAISSSDSKRKEAAELGAHNYLVWKDANDVKKYNGYFTHILCTSFGTPFPWKAYFSMMRPNGHFIMVALPETTLDGIPPGLLAMRQISLEGSMIGSPKQIREMLEFAAEHKVKPWIQKYPMKDCNEAVQAMRDGKARFRFVLEN